MSTRFEFVGVEGRREVLPPPSVVGRRGAIAGVEGQITPFRPMRRDRIERRSTGVPAVGLALVLYGAGNGIYSIARGTVPLALFGPVRYPVLVGRLARPVLIAQAVAPSLGAVALTYGGADAAYGVLVALALANLGMAIALWGARPDVVEGSDAVR